MCRDTGDGSGRHAGVTRDHRLAAPSKNYGSRPTCALTEDDEFLQRALYETIRLHTSGRKIHPRVAVRDVTLASSGTRFGPGDRVGLHLAAANRDPRVYGPDADRFDPRRADRLDRTVKPYGTGFAAGTHMCLGKDLVTGDLEASGRPGILLEVLRRTGAG
ncbi:cytochrome P450 [Actinophytocola sp.]|uniref:cytochrome P450 n=1 Tax=Actinophytocola sp. TaxID=1872138 RepID=UPI003D6B879D